MQQPLNRNMMENTIPYGKRGDFYARSQNDNFKNSPLRRAFGTFRIVGKPNSCNGPYSLVPNVTHRSIEKHARTLSEIIDLNYPHA